MKFTLNWLKDHLNTHLNVSQISDALTKLGIEVEEIIDYSQLLNNIVVGRIIEAEQHPNADKLKICKVDIGNNTILNIVCGAPNARAGIFVAVAQVGSIIPATKTILKKAIIRGIESQGMMCSASELSIDKDKADGIIELSNNVNVGLPIIGQPIVEALQLNDVIFDVSITPNRSDCFSVRGIARDLSAAGYGELLPLKISEIKYEIQNNIELSLETNNCPYFSTLSVKSFNGETPLFIANRLKLIGQKLISCPVDIANYICFDIGQPMHIFDLDKLYDSKIIIRNSVNGESIKTLNNSKEEILPEGSIVVASNKELLSIPGIIGGQDTGVSQSSTNLLVESAYFDKVAITKTGQALKILTDARTRFERGVDPNNVEIATKYFVSLLSTSCPNIKISNIKSVGKLPQNEFEIKLTKEKFINLTGLSESEYLKSAELLTNLGCQVLSKTEESLTVLTPSWRHDLKIEEDLIEEILRLIGFDVIKDQQLPNTAPIITTDIIDKMCDALVYNNYYEVKTFSMLDNKLAEMFINTENIIHISDSLSNEFSVLRPSIIPSHLKKIIQTQNRSQDNLKIFEVAKQFYLKDNNVLEENMLVATVTKTNKYRHWINNQDISVFYIKSSLEKLLNMVTSNYRITDEAPNYYHPGRSGSFILKSAIAYFGELHPKLLEQLEIKGSIFSFEIFVDRLPNINKIKSPIVLSPYQPVTRDFSFIIDKEIPVGQILYCIKKLHIKELKNISIFDIYESEVLGKNKKAVAFEVLLQSDKATLADNDIQNISQKIIESITKNCQGILRDK